jgi:hypothetical protein
MKWYALHLILGMTLHSILGMTTKIKKKFAQGWKNANYDQIGVKIVENLN